ncbi:IS110 family transposase [Williamsia herbipolensis]|uniref:IS110 family transposase n=1 Tax=Williamsia herbipolensis TaxID=1603258 RepID=UPI0005F77C98|nr:IS110 family transposase [Williamsia herbipolensis]
MHVIGIDPHKLSHTATSVEPSTNTDLGSLRVPSTLEGYQQLLDWSATWPDRVWAIENAKGLGHHLAQWLIQAGETVVDVPSTATARVRELSRGGRRKTDRIDAAAAACVAFTQADYRPVEADGDRAIIRLLDERRTDVANQHSRVINQLHAVLRELLPGGVATNQRVEQIRHIVVTHQPATPADEMRKTVALEIIGDLRRLRFQLDELTERIITALEASGSTLTSIAGVGPICAARLVARIGNPTRFASEAAFASYVGTAPIDVSSGDHNRHRLSRSGDRKLNAVIHIIAVSQSRHPSAPGYSYYRRKITEGKTRREAQRCLKRQITKQIWRTMQHDNTTENLAAA